MQCLSKEKGRLELFKNKSFEKLPTMISYIRYHWLPHVKQFLGRRKEVNGEMFLSKYLYLMMHNSQRESYEGYRCRKGSEMY